MVMRSVRLERTLDERLQRAAAVAGESVSEFIRVAVDERAERTLTAEPTDFDDVIGVVRGGGGRARRTGDAFRRVVDRR